MEIQKSREGRRAGNAEAKAFSHHFSPAWAMPQPEEESSETLYQPCLWCLSLNLYERLDSYKIERPWMFPSSAPVSLPSALPPECVRYVSFLQEQGHSGFGGEELLTL